MWGGWLGWGKIRVPSGVSDGAAGYIGRAEREVEPIRGFIYGKCASGNLVAYKGGSAQIYRNTKQRQALTAILPSCPKTRSSLFQPTTLWIFRLLSLSKTTSKGTPGLTRESLVKSAP